MDAKFAKRLHDAAVAAVEGAQRKIEMCQADLAEAKQALTRHKSDLKQAKADLRAAGGTPEDDEPEGDAVEAHAETAEMKAEGN